jgi:transcriptional regulator with XRE-family HTH domain
MTKPTTNTADRARFALVAALYKQQLGEVIKDRREALGLTQKDLADRANVEEPQTVSRWERGLNSPTDLDSVAKALETTVDELLRHLKPINQKERRRLLPGSGEATQLDRIEAKLDLLLQAVIPSSPAEVAEEAAARRTADKRSATGSGRAGKSRSRRVA